MANQRGGLGSSFSDAFQPPFYRCRFPQFPRVAQVASCLPHSSLVPWPSILFWPISCPRRCGHNPRGRKTNPFPAAGRDPIPPNLVFEVKWPPTSPVGICWERRMAISFHHANKLLLFHAVFPSHPFLSFPSPPPIRRLLGSHANFIPLILPNFSTSNIVKANDHFPL